MVLEVRELRRLDCGIAMQPYHKIQWLASKPHLRRIFGFYFTKNLLSVPVQHYSR